MSEGPPREGPAHEGPPRSPLWPADAAEVARITGARLSGDPGVRVLRVSTDSRSALREGDLFVGLAGPHFDGGRFAAEALARGASAVLIGPEAANRESFELPPGRAVLTVDDPLAALHALAAEARRRFSGTVVAVTGSNGKTTVKDMLTAALGRRMRVTASPLSYNSQVGVALTLLGLDPAAEVAVVECGISEVGEMARLEQLVRPDRGILTTIGDAHLAGLGDRETTAREKAGLFRRVGEGGRGGDGAAGWVLTGAGEPLARAALDAVGAPTLLIEGSEGSAAGPAPAPVPKSESGLPEPRFRIAETEDGRPCLVASPAESGEEERVVPLELAGPPSAPWRYDAALAAAAALLLGAEPEAVAEGLAAWHPAPMRLELSTTPRGLLLINDAYTADPVSMESALEALMREGGPRGRDGGRAVAVLGGMAQLGLARGKAHARVGRRVAELGLDRLIGVGPGGEEIAAAARQAGMPAERVAVVADVSAAALELEEHCRPGDRVLLKASRPERLERIAELLAEAVAPARLYVDLDGIVANYRGLRRLAGPECKVMAVVKSFGYGLDSLRVSRALEHAGADAFAVAYPDEGVLLRDHGITAPVLVQNLLPGEVGKVVRHGLAAQVSSAAQVPWLADEAARQRRAVPVHLKVDTGMGRSGVSPDEALAVARAVHDQEWLELEGLATHFAAADDPAQDDFTREQIRRFDAVRAALAQAGLVPPLVHAAASAAIARFPEARYDMVRAGLALFGYCEAIPDRRPVLRLTTRVITVKEIPPGHSVGYARTYQAEGVRKIAVVAVGYNDGYPWALSNKGWMAVAGRRCPVLGRVSMDVTTLDVSDVPGVRPGDEVVVFGPGPGEPDLTDLARLAGTLPYELLTRLSSRIRRIFWHGEAE